MKQHKAYIIYVYIHTHIDRVYIHIDSYRTFSQKHHIFYFIYDVDVMHYLHLLIYMFTFFTKIWYTSVIQHSCVMSYAVTESASTDANLGSLWTLYSCDSCDIMRQWPSIYLLTIYLSIQTDFPIIFFNLSLETSNSKPDWNIASKCCESLHVYL